MLFSIHRSITFIKNKLVLISNLGYQSNWVKVTKIKISFFVSNNIYS